MKSEILTRQIRHGTGSESVHVVRKNGSFLDPGDWPFHSCRPMDAALGPATVFETADAQHLESGRHGAEHPADALADQTERAVAVWTNARIDADALSRSPESIPDATLLHMDRSHSVAPVIADKPGRDMRE